MLFDSLLLNPDKNCTRIVKIRKIPKAFCITKIFNDKSTELLGLKNCFVELQTKS